MRSNPFKAFSLLLILLVLSCTKDEMGELTVNLTYGEEGLVEVTASASKAVLYRFSFGPDAVFENTSGVISYSYQNKGSYTLGVWSFFDEELSNYSYKTIEIEIVNAPGEGTDAIDPSLIDTSEEATVYSGFELAWSDEFNYEGSPAEEKWHHQIIPIFGGGWANNEKQHYTARLDNSFVSNGTLKIVAKRENYSYQGSQKAYTSARLNSKFDFQYGRIDVRAKLPASEGTWPAIWTLGSNIGEKGNYFGTEFGNVGWPECGEIDIVEQRGGNKEELLGTFHWLDRGSNQNASYGLTKTTANLKISDVTEDFHIYSMVWSASKITLYVDGNVLSELAIGSVGLFDNPHYLLLNLAMGGTLGGNIPNSFEQDTLEIDYVRYYR